jgi:hypothetical protein
MHANVVVMAFGTYGEKRNDYKYLGGNMKIEDR